MGENPNLQRKPRQCTCPCRCTIQAASNMSVRDGVCYLCRNDRHVQPLDVRQIITEANGVPEESNPCRCGMKETCGRVNHPSATEADPKPCKSGHLLPTETCRDCDFMPEHDPLACKNGDHEDCFRAQLSALEAICICSDRDPEGQNPRCERHPPRNQADPKVS